MANDKSYIGEPPKPLMRVGDFTIYPWGDVNGTDSWYVEDKTTEASTFPVEDIKKILAGKNPEKALREYYDKNF